MYDLHRISQEMCILRLSFINVSFQPEMRDILLEVFHFSRFYPNDIQYGQKSVLGLEFAIK